MQRILQIMYSVCIIIQSLFSNVDSYKKCKRLALENQGYNPALYCYHRNVETMQLVTDLGTNLASQKQECIRPQDWQLPCIDMQSNRKIIVVSALVTKGLQVNTLLIKNLEPSCIELHLN